MEFKDTYNSLIALVEKNTDGKIKELIQSNGFIDNFNSLLKKKDNIESDLDLQRHKDNLERLFDELKNQITTPEVKQFINWLSSIDEKSSLKELKILEKKILNKYQNYDKIINEIMLNNSILDFGNSIFKNSLKNIKILVCKKIEQLNLKDSNLIDEISDTIEDINNVLVNLNQISELTFQTESDFFMQEDNTENTDPTKLAIFESFKHLFRERNSITEKKDYELSKVSSDLSDIIKDSRNTLELLLEINKEIVSNEQILDIFNKFEKDKILKIKLNLSENSAEKLSELIKNNWQPLITNFNNGTDFLDKYNDIVADNSYQEIAPFSDLIIDYLNKKKEIQKIVEKYSNKSIAQFNSFDELANNYSTLNKAIERLNLTQLFNDAKLQIENLLEDFEKTKLSIFEKFPNGNDVINELKTKQLAVTNGINSLSEYKIDELISDDTLTSTINSYDTLIEMYEEKIIAFINPDAMKFYHSINDFSSFTYSEIEQNSEIIKELNEKQLITLAIQKVSK